MPLPCSALVLTAGLGTRLRPLTHVRAKPAIPVAGVPMIRRIIAWLAAGGVTDLVLNLHHLPDTLSGVVGDGSDMSARVRYSWEPVVLGSAGGPRRALPIVGADTFFVINGDTLTNVDLRVVANAHDASGALVTLALVPNSEPHRYGGVSLDAARRVTGFPRRGPAAEGSYHFVGVQVVSAEAFRGLPDGQPVNSIGEVYDSLMATRPGAVCGHVCDADFWDVGTTSDYWQMSRAFAAAESGGEMPAGRGTRIDASARVTRSILWDDVDVGKGCTVDECIITDGVRVPPGSRHVRQILVSGRGGQVTASADD